MLNNERTNGYSIAWEEFFPIRNICPRSHKSLFESLLGLTRTPPMNIMSTLESVYSEETLVISVRELDENGVLLFFKITQKKAITVSLSMLWISHGKTSLSINIPSFVSKRVIYSLLSPPILYRLIACRIIELSC